MKSSLSHHAFFAAILIAGMGVVSNASALIGESAEQTDQRYGTPVKRTSESRSYKKAGLDITVQFYNGYADNITYHKFLKDSKGLPLPLTFEEIAVLLDNNSNGQEWKDLAKGYDPDYHSKKMWQCKLYHLQAYFDEENQALVVLMNHRKNSKKEDEKLIELHSQRPKVDHEKLLNIIGV